MIYIHNAWKLKNYGRRLESMLLDSKITEASGVEEPVILDDVKKQLRITGIDDDDYLTTLIKSDRQQIEKYCGISIVEKTVQAHINNEAGAYELPFGPVKSIGTALDADDVVLEIETRGLDYPMISTALDFINVTYTTGYVTVPEDLKQAILKQVAWDYEHRGDEGGINGLCDEAKVKAKQYRRVTWLA